jgi:hypothetical protein
MTLLNITILAVLFVATVLVIGKYDFEKKQNHID